jgi:hypothetical protein
MTGRCELSSANETLSGSTPDGQLRRGNKMLIHYYDLKETKQ